MRSYIIRRLLLMIPTIFFVSLIIFIMIRLIPGSVIDIMVSEYGTYGTVTKVDRQAIEHALGMDVPIICPVWSLGESDCSRQPGDFLVETNPCDGRYRSKMASNLRTWPLSSNSRPNNSSAHRYIFSVATGYMGRLM